MKKTDMTVSFVVNPPYKKIQKQFSKFILMKHGMIVHQKAKDQIIELTVRFKKVIKQTITINIVN